MQGVINNDREGGSFVREPRFLPAMKPLFLLLLTASLATAAEPTPPQGKTAEATELIVATPFDQDAPKTRKGPINGWQAGIGEWWVADGALHGNELAENNHPSSCTYKFEATDLMITAEFRLGESPQIAFACRDTVPPNNHLGRTFITPEAVWVTRMSGISKTTKNEKLAEKKVKIDPDEWHTITIEITGDHYRAKVDDTVVEATHERYKDAKGIVALVSKGEGAQFRNVQLWHAKAK